MSCLEDQSAAAESGSLSSRILRHSTRSAWAASNAGDPAICPACSASLARRNRCRHSGGLPQNPLPWPQPHPSVSKPGGTNGIPFRASRYMHVLRPEAQTLNAFSPSAGFLKLSETMLYVVTPTSDLDVNAVFFFFFLASGFKPVWDP